MPTRGTPEPDGDDDAAFRGLPAWAVPELALYGVQDWPGRSTIGVASGVGGEVRDGVEAMRATAVPRVEHVVADGRHRSVSVTSGHAGDRHGLATWVPARTLRDIVSARLGPGARAEQRHRALTRLRAQVSGGRVSWTTAAITVDGEPTRFDLLDLGDVWIAVGCVERVVITVESRLVPLAGLRLVRIAVPTPAAHRRAGRPSLLSPQSSAALDAYVSALSRAGGAPGAGADVLGASTVRSYVWRARRYLVWLEDVGASEDCLDDPAARRIALLHYRSHLRSVVGSKSSTVVSHVTAIGDFHRRRDWAHAAAAATPV